VGASTLVRRRCPREELNLSLPGFVDQVPKSVGEGIGETREGIEPSQLVLQTIFLPEKRVVVGGVGIEPTWSAMS
jgi:hypothetical protein